jgi:hypothetical protein
VATATLAGDVAERILIDRRRIDAAQGIDGSLGKGLPPSNDSVTAMKRLTGREAWLYRLHHIGMKRFMAGGR